MSSFPQMHLSRHGNTFKANLFQRQWVITKNSVLHEDNMVILYLSETNSHFIS